MVAFRNRSVYKKTYFTNNTSSSFDKIDNFNGSFENSFFQIYFMMAGDNQNENMGIENLTWPNFVTFVIYFFFIFLISSLALNIFTGIAINEIHEMLKAYNIRIMKDKIDYIYDGGYSISEWLKFFPCCEGIIQSLEKYEKWLFEKITKVKRLIKWIVEKIRKICTLCRNKVCGFVDTKQTEKKINFVESDFNQMDFVDEKYVENFETLEYSVKTLEDKSENRSKTLEDKLDNRTKTLEDKLDLILSNNSLPENRIKESEEKFENRIKDLEGKFNTILEKLEQIIPKN